MEFFKTSALFLAIISTGFLIAQEKSDPVASVITSDSEATSVLGGGWPPQSFGRRVGNSTAKDILEGAKNKVLKISDAVEESVKKNSTVKTIDRNLIAQGSSSKGSAPRRTPSSSQGSSSKGSAPKRTTNNSTSIPAPQPIFDTTQIVIPPTPDNSKSSSSGLSPLVLPPLPTIEDKVTPAISARAPRGPRPKRKRVRSLYTLGPGDSVSFSAFDRADLERTVRIAPDGTVSYLQAVAVNANGLTVDELRDKMELELQNYRRDFKLIVSPQELLSKEFAILGRVQEPGTFPLTRPTTVLEGIALAEGVETGTIRGSAFGLADFERSFVSRSGRKLDVDFSKLYFEGDLEQNVFLQPNDYIYVASVLKNEFHILGAVNAPGRIKIPNRVTVTSAVSLAGGFVNEAYRSKVLVIRGDINNPEVHVVSVRDVVRGNARDMEIEPGDIVFVARRPFEILERVVDSAITTYVQTVTAEAINLNYNPFSG